MEIINKFLKKIGYKKDGEEKKDKSKTKIKIEEEKTMDIEIPKIEPTENFNRDEIVFEEDNAYGISHKGNRTNNEDNILIKKIKDTYILAVADGVGGHSSGDVASKMAVDILENIIMEKYNENLSIEEIKELLKDAYITAHNKIKENAIGDKEGMGTTLTTAIVKGDKCVIANCGDSRAYLIRDGEIVFRTKDHSLVQVLVDEGHISEEDARHHPMKNIITSALGLDEFKVDDYEWDLIDGDVLLMSSDGLHDYVSKEDILKTVKNNDHPKDIVDELFNTALKETRDNVSIIVYKKQ
ncbi:PP2C family protein-serine/threonine phosphatase [Methanothermococcus thermolithotrophicus]|jgi:protein phosphatase|uniref:PP2C family protein-serine/threonine phosphatase n=1 Tax=Methanothermococcus thermolithotrophicus TaxID=2186 RepID=UPI000382A71A|nr:protein phosphatase 2C domain-containing protein [Methanothermococcus thermolithotrophicus]MDK2946486.1 family protein phosphatase [Geotoga sp.]